MVGSVWRGSRSFLVAGFGFRWTYALLMNTCVGNMVSIKQEHLGSFKMTSSNGHTLLLTLEQHNLKMSVKPCSKTKVMQTMSAI
jgi:hypothetical protein